MVQNIIRLSARPGLQPIIRNEAQHEIQDQYLCAEKTKRVLGWQPRYTLTEGLQETLAWYAAFLAHENATAV
jgi:nucleoside-diphosphate-sugar epimerase